MAGTDTLYTLIRDAARRLDRPVALASKRDGRWEPISHARMLERVRHLSLGLHELGVRKGDRVAVLSESRPEWTMLDLATLGCASALVPIYPTLTEDQVAHILGDSGARVCVVSDRSQLDKVAPLASGLPALEKIVLIEPGGALEGENLLSLDELEAMGAAAERRSPGLADRLAAESSADDLATLIYTSGTTGRQKGVMLTHRNFLANLDATFEESGLVDASDVALSYLPLAHIFERTAVYGFLRKGVTVYYATSFDHVARELREVRPTISTSVPRLFEKMYEKICDTGRAAGGLKSLVFERALRCGDRYARASHAGDSVNPLVQLEYDAVANRFVFDKWRDAVGGRLRYFISGGAPLASDIAYAFLGAGMPIYEGYGLTETSPVIALNRPAGHRVGTVGRPLSNLEVRIAEDGEICVRGPSVMQGYFNLPEQTAETFTEDGFFKTGDVGHLDADGFLVITDRKKDLLKTSGGKYVAPQPIENALKASSLISQAVVIGDRRKFCSALIVPNFDALGPALAARGVRVDNGDELVRDPRVVALYLETVDKLTPNLARFEKIKKVALLPRELTIAAGEMTPTLKVKRRVVEERYKDLIDGMYEDSGDRGAPAHD
jgi:long-chain acyl-CoA synthetase